MKRTITFDDIDGESEATETIVFSIGDEQWEIDLSTEHADEFTKAVSPYVEAARPYSPAKAAPVKAALTKDERAQLITWAAANGVEVSPRGRVASEIVTRWKASLETAEEPAQGTPTEQDNEDQAAAEPQPEEQPASESTETVVPAEPVETPVEEASTSASTGRRGRKT